MQPQHVFLKEENINLIQYETTVGNKLANSQLKQS